MPSTEGKKKKKKTNNDKKRQQPHHTTHTEPCLDAFQPGLCSLGLVCSHRYPRGGGTVPLSRAGTAGARGTYVCGAGGEAGSGDGTGEGRSNEFFSLSRPSPPRPLQTAGGAISPSAARTYGQTDGWMAEGCALARKYRHLGLGPNGASVEGGGSHPPSPSRAPAAQHMRSAIHPTA